jgi:hypothetical protein
MGYDMPLNSPRTPSALAMAFQTAAAEFCWQLRCCRRTRSVSNGWPAAMPTMPLAAPAGQFGAHVVVHGTAVIPLHFMRNNCAKVQGDVASHSEGGDCAQRAAQQYTDKHSSSGSCYQPARKSLVACPMLQVPTFASTPISSAV